MLKTGGSSTQEKITIINAIIHGKHIPIYQKDSYIINSKIGQGDAVERENTEDAS